MEIINLDMVPGKKSPVCHASQYDDGRVIRFKLYDSGLPFTLDGTETITFEVRKPDGNIVTSTLTNTSDSYVDVVTTEQMTAVKGANLCEVRVEKGGTNIGSLNVIMAVEMDPTDGGIASASEIDNLRSQVSGMVAEEVAEQYDAGSVIFDSAPTPGHGNGYAVTSEGIATALGNKADRSELPDMTNYYNKTETDGLLNQKADASSLSAVATSGSYNDLTDKPTIPTNAEQLPITSGSATNTKDYIDTGLSGKADKTALKYKVGDTLDLSGLYLIGQVSNGRYRFICNLPLPKSVEDIASASVSSLSYAIIGNGGYFTPPAGMTTTFTSSAKTCNGLQMTMYFSADFSSLTLDDIYLARIISGTLTFA